MRNVENSDSDEEERQQRHGEETSDTDEEVAPPNPHGVDEQDDYLSSSSDEYDTEDEDEERDPDEEDAIYADHIETIREFVQPCPSLQTQGWATEFTFRTLDEDDNRIEDIAELVNVVLRKLIRDAKANALAQGYQGGWIGLGWKSELMEKTFVIPYGHESHNNPRKLLTAFEGFDQSATENDLYGQIIRVQVTIVNSPPAGAGRKSTRSLVSIGEQKDKKDALLEIRNKDTLCLFKSIVVAIAYDEAPRKLSCRNFLRLLDDDADQTRRARELMDRCGIPDDLPAYSVIHLTPVQDYLSRHYPERYRLLVFSADNGEEDKPVFNGRVNAEKSLVLWHEEGHFDAVKTVEKLFKPKKNNLYCPACECFYHGAPRHTRYCPIRCPMCLRMGHGYPQRCRSNDVAQHRQCVSQSVSEEPDDYEARPIPAQTTSSAIRRQREIHRTGRTKAPFPRQSRDSFSKRKGRSSSTGVARHLGHRSAQRVYDEVRRHVPAHLVTLAQVEDYLKEERTYTLYRKSVRRFRRQKTIPDGLNTDWQADLAHFRRIAPHNDDVQFMLVCVDVLSRMIYVEPVKNNTTAFMVPAFNAIFQRAGVHPWKIFTDCGREFESVAMKAFFKRHHVLKFHSEPSRPLHAMVAERAIRTVKERLFKFFSERNTVRWHDDIQTIVDAINHSVCRMTGVRPADVTERNAHALRERLYGDESRRRRRPKFEVGDRVRVQERRILFAKGLNTFTDKLFRVTKVRASVYPPRYRLVDGTGVALPGEFYERELVRATTDAEPSTRVERIVQWRNRADGGRDALVKWIGHEARFNSWVAEEDIDDYQPVVAMGADADDDDA